MLNQWQFKAQCLLVLAALAGALFIWSGNKTGFDMLGYLDERIACQEDEKDVRCWSSVNKIQMFLAGAAINHDAMGVRVENYMKLFDSVWQESVGDSLEHEVEIPVARLLGILKLRFPHSTDAETGEVEFTFSQQSEPVLVMADSIKDYSDTIEAWRLLQAWASRKTDKTGKLTLTPVFSRDAIDAFHKFLVAYDIAILKNARRIANDRKLVKIDDVSMELAFENEWGQQEWGQ
jgi:hypothetical protein